MEGLLLINFLYTTNSPRYDDGVDLLLLLYKR